MKKIIGILLTLCIVVACGVTIYVTRMKQTEPASKQNNSEGVTKEIVTTEATTEVTTTQSTTTQQETTQEVTTQEPEKKPIISIDPGHQAPSVDMSAQEPNAPGSSVMKRKATGGTTGTFTGVPEYQLNLTISLKLKKALEKKGYTVVLTRRDNETAISNKERAELANDSGADIAIRIHANGSEQSSANGALMLVGSQKNPYVGKLYQKSYRLAQKVLDCYCNETGMKNDGIQANDTMTGINWSKIPVVILEMGFMTNQSDDSNMQNEQYQDKMVNGIVKGIEQYYEE